MTESSPALARDLYVPHGDAVLLARSFCPSGYASGAHGLTYPCDDCTIAAVKALADLRRRGFISWRNRPPAHAIRVVLSASGGGVDSPTGTVPTPATETFTGHDPDLCPGSDALVEPPFSASDPPRVRCDVCGNGVDVYSDGPVYRKRSHGRPERVSAD